MTAPTVVRLDPSDLPRLLALQQFHKLSLFTGELKQVEHSRALENLYQSIPIQYLPGISPRPAQRAEFASWEGIFV